MRASRLRVWLGGGDGEGEGERGRGVLCCCGGSVQHNGVVNLRRERGMGGREEVKLSGGEEGGVGVNEGE